MLRAVRELAGPVPLRCVVAWSGGLDSTLLLHLLAAQRGRRNPSLQLRAVHVDHGLQAAAAGFRVFCRQQARRWRIPLQVVRLRMTVPAGDSLEEAARIARRDALAHAVRPGELLLTAQHADDQLETLLLALLRGAGPRGLAGMAPCAPLGAGRLLRPLLQFDRSAIAACAMQASMDWVEDPTNADERFDRNYLRARVLPQLRARWPAAARTAVRAARHAAAAAGQLAQMAATDLDAAADGAGLDIPILRRLSATRRAVVLRAWILRAGARAPNERHLLQIEAMMAARADAHPLLRLPDCIVRRAGARLLLDALQVRAGGGGR